MFKKVRKLTNQDLLDFVKETKKLPMVYDHMFLERNGYVDFFIVSKDKRLVIKMFGEQISLKKLETVDTKNLYEVTKE